ncbi:MAG TPA: hypothetical protein VGL73_03540, partial [Caulobacteraceae bacterium]
GVLVFLVSALRSPPAPAEAVPIVVELVDERPPAPADHPKPAPAATVTEARPVAADPVPAETPARPAVARRSPQLMKTASLAASDAVADEPGNALSEAQIAGAASVDSGPTDRPCDMARRLQSALRKDPLVQAAVASAAGRAIMVWDGDWVRNRGEDGKGLAAVREAITWEVAFAPQACRAEPVHGLVLISMGQAQGSARLALGLEAWRWADLLKPGPEG